LIEGGKGRKRKKNNQEAEKLKNETLIEGDRSCFEGEQEGSCMRYD